VNKPRPLVLRPDLNDFRVQAVLDWLTTVPDQRTPGTQRALADELGVSHQYITAWKNDPDFLAEWERRYRKAVGSPEKQQQVLEALHATAIDRTDPRQVPAARAYLEATDAIKPKKIDVTVNKDAKALSDEELNALLALEAEREMQRRAHQ
jgi:transcriptional regulator with XRE-family HTH domain